MNHAIKSEHFSKQSPVRLLQISDCHLMAEADREFAGISPYQSLQAVLSHAQKNVAFDCVINTGDIAQQALPQTYELYQSTLSKLERPHYWVRGNHDESKHFPSLSDNDQPTVIDLGAWCMILINSQVDQKVWGLISDHDLIQLDRLLTQHQHQYAIIALHHNTFDVGCEWLAPHRLQNSEQLLACLNAHDHVRLVISGHVHQDFSYQHRQMTFLSCPSTSIQFKPKQIEFCLDQIAPGYRLIELHANGHFDSVVHRVEDAVGHVDFSLKSY